MGFYEQFPENKRLGTRGECEHDGCSKDAISGTCMWPERCGCAPCEAMVMAWFKEYGQSALPPGEEKGGA